MEKILIIEDEIDMVRGLKDNLEYEGYKVISAGDGLEGIARTQKEKPDLIILDIMLPKMNGFDVCKELRAKKINIPVLMLTAKGEEVDKVLGLEIGADDYVTKPFSVRELLARVKALLRRTGKPYEQIKSYEFGNVKLDFKKCIATKRKKKIELSYFEVEILKLLIAHKDEPVTREEILDQIWGLEAYPTNRTVDNYVVRLRQKLEDDPKAPEHIVTVHRIGYKFLP
ncbi:response regulator transcription factor [candidate division WOR-3 bacterium]|nr:response regulator transcription factor [candidate division WOR-3 bacterium]